MKKKKMKQKRFYILQANSLNKEDIAVGGLYRYDQIATVRKNKTYEGQKTLKVQTLAGAHRMRLTYFQDRNFYIRVQRGLELLEEIPTGKQEKSKLYRKTVDIHASEKFLGYIDSLPKEIVKPETPLSQLWKQEQ
jgi:hypothetical protein